MRKAIIGLAGVLAALLAWIGAAPASAVGDWGTQAAPPAQNWDWGAQTPQSPTTTSTAGNGYAMGVRPNYYTICVANGYGPSAGGPVLSWNYTGFRLDVRLQNRCDGYSVTNRLTIDNVNNSGSCIQYTRLNSTAPTKYFHDVWSGYIWNNNPVVWINTSAACFQNSAQLYHNMAKGIGYILGLAYSTCTDCVMGNNNLIYNATYGDAVDANVIYQ